MNGSTHGLRKDLTEIRTLLAEGTFLSLSEEERAHWLTESTRLIGKLDRLAESYLTVGLLGGTGVGKSSIMNALAGSDISSTSHRRPHTDKVLIYRHVEVELPPALNSDDPGIGDRAFHKAGVPGGGAEPQPSHGTANVPRPWREITHTADSIRQIILCDLPDFDSLVGRHREYVLRFLEHLDVLVWVVSPEKYADALFYAFLRDAPKASQNYYFALNKVDLLFQDQSPEVGHERLAKIMARFRRHLVENGIEGPAVFAVSALKVLQQELPAPWCQFGSLREHLFRHRGAKEVLAIKAANLDVEIQQVLQAMERELLSLESLRQLLRELITELEEDRADWKRTGSEAYGAWLETQFRRYASSRLEDPAALVGPGYAIALLVDGLRRWRGEREEEKAEGEAELGETGALRRLERLLSRIEDRTANRLLRRGLPSTLIDSRPEIPSAGQLWKDMTRRLHQFLEMHFPDRKSTPLRGFRGLQYLVYSVLLSFFLLAMGGDEAWRQLLEAPGWKDVATMALSMIRTLFSPVGLAALATYLLLLFFFGFRFYTRYRKYLQRRTQKFIESLKIDLEKMWEDELNTIIARLEDYSRDLETQLSAIADLRRARQKE